MKTMYKYLSMMLVALLFAGCFEHIPEAEKLPQEAVSFTYLIPGDYPLDYYVGSDIEFTSTSAAKGTATWDFGDKTDPIVISQDSVVTHFYATAGTYYVKLTITQADGTQASKTQPLMISDIKPLMTILPFEDGICEVLTTDVNFEVELPNPQDLEEKFVWTFPEGTTWADGSVIENGVYSSDKWELPQALRFAHVGSQNVRLSASLAGRQLEEAAINVQVGYNKEVPTLYYATKGGNIMALKLADDAPEGMNINPFDLGVSAGQHPFNLLFEDSTLFLLDAGKQFYYVNDEDGVLGDGKISAIAKDGSKVETVITNVGQAAFDDPFYGYIEDGILYYANRNTGVVAIGANERNKVYSAAEFPWFFQNATTTYYKQGIEYGAIGGCFGKVEGTWYWTKFYNANGIFRFKDSDILKESISQATGTPPADGIALSSMRPKSFAYNKATKEFFFTVLDDGYNGFYRCANIDELNAIGNSKKNLTKHEIKHTSGASLEANKTGIPALYEGHGDEVVGICQLALDEATGCIYFGYRPAAGSSMKPGLMRYNPAINQVETVLEGVELYGLVINQQVSKLF